tara:strand:+ start:326 stop:601 length:276 start_codon:yes stop_codon:yes gene_type:complete
MRLEDKIIAAIRKINADAEVTLSITPDKSWSIEWLNGTAEISKSDIEAKMLTIENEIAQAETDKANKKASGKQKLLDLGLDEDEVKALIGA